MSLLLSIMMACDPIILLSPPRTISSSVFCLLMVDHVLYEFSQALTIQCKNVSCKECVAGSTKWYLSEAATVRNESVATFFAPFEAAAVVCQHG